MTRVLGADEATRAVARSRIREQIAALGERGQRNLVEILRILDDARRRIVSTLATATDFDRGRYTLLLGDVDRELRRIRQEMPSALARGMADAVALGDADTLSQAREILPDDPFGISTGVSRSLVEMASGRSADLVGQITETARAQLNEILRRAATSAAKPVDVARQIGAVLDDAGRPTGTFGTLALQIERVHRTETAALYEQAGEARRTEIARTSPFEIQKTWITIRDGRQRPEHDAMNGVTVPQDESFNYGADAPWHRVSYEQASREGGSLGLAVSGPHDPALPARDAVNCRCAVGLRRGPRKEPA